MRVCGNERDSVPLFLVERPLEVGSHRQGAGFERNVLGGRRPNLVQNDINGHTFVDQAVVDRRGCRLANPPTTGGLSLLAGRGIGVSHRLRSHS